MPWCTSGRPSRPPSPRSIWRRRAGSAGWRAFFLSFFITQRDADRQLGAASPVWRSLSPRCASTLRANAGGRSLAGSCTEYARPTRQMRALRGSADALGQ